MKIIKKTKNWKIIDDKFLKFAIAHQSKSSEYEYNFDRLVTKKYEKLENDVIKNYNIDLRRVLTKDERINIKNIYVFPISKKIKFVFNEALSKDFTFESIGNFDYLIEKDKDI